MAVGSSLSRKPPFPNHSLCMDSSQFQPPQALSLTTLSIGHSTTSPSGCEISAQGSRIHRRLPRRISERSCSKTYSSCSIPIGTAEKESHVNRPMRQPKCHPSGTPAHLSVPHKACVQKGPRQPPPNVFVSPRRALPRDLNLASAATHSLPPQPWSSSPTSLPSSSP